MSRSVDLFIDAKVPLEDLAAALREKLELSLTPDAERRRWLLRDGDIAAFLHEHPYVDDVNLPFSHYRFALSARVGHEGRPQDSAEAAYLRRLAQRIQQGPHWPVLLVLDLQFRDAAMPARLVPASDADRGPTASADSPAAPSVDATPAPAPVTGPNPAPAAGR